MLPFLQLLQFVKGKRLIVKVEFPSDEPRGLLQDISHSATASTMNSFITRLPCISIRFHLPPINCSLSRKCNQSVRIGPRGRFIWILTEASFTKYFPWAWFKFSNQREVTEKFLSSMFLLSHLTSFFFYKFPVFSRCSQKGGFPSINFDCTPALAVIWKYQTWKPLQPGTMHHNQEHELNSLLFRFYFLETFSTFRVSNQTGWVLACLAICSSCKTSLKSFILYIIIVIFQHQS